MLSSPTPFPYVGSYALLEHEGELQLVRIQMRRSTPTVGEDGRATETGETVVSFPLRDGASGNIRVDPALLIDASPLSADEMRAFHELDRSLRGKFHGDTVGEDGRRIRLTPKQKADLARRDAMRWRMIHAPIAMRLMRKLRDRQQREAA
jgi:hypothetical protein